MFAQGSDIYIYMFLIFNIYLYILSNGVIVIVGIGIDMTIIKEKLIRSKGGMDEALKEYAGRKEGAGETRRVWICF